jgi:hypothetical protein
MTRVRDRVARSSSARCGAIAAAFVLTMAEAPQARACNWWWACADRPSVARATPRAHAYRPWAYGGAGWAYGYSNPARFYDPYAAWPSTSIPQSRWYTSTALQVPNAAAVGLTAPISSGPGLLESALPARGPSLFGPPPPPSYYGSPSYGYLTAPSYAPPPSDTPSWWLEPRRRR